MPSVIVPRPKSMSRTARKVALLAALLRTGGILRTSAFIDEHQPRPGHLDDHDALEVRR